MDTPNKGEPKPMPTIWQVPDELWEHISSIIRELDPPKHTGRKRIDPRAALDAIIFRMRSGCQWNHMPSDFPDDSSVHRTFQRWEQLGVFDAVWASLVTECADIGGVNWEWQAVDGAIWAKPIGKARFGGTQSGVTPPTGANVGRNATC